MLCAFCVAFCVAFCFVFCVAFCVVFCAYTLADSGERRKPRRTGHFGARGGQDKECVFKLSWPSTAEYRMMKLKKKQASWESSLGVKRKEKP